MYSNPSLASYMTSPIFVYSHGAPNHDGEDLSVWPRFAGTEGGVTETDCPVCINSLCLHRVHGSTAVTNDFDDLPALDDPGDFSQVVEEFLKGATGSTRCYHFAKYVIIVILLHAICVVHKSPTTACKQLLAWIFCLCVEKHACHCVGKTSPVEFTH
ncbi:hypothetical protein M758_UG169700 [Ceratodon purpureus]|nr:hypothetical protein M758_UG169700 [Ceratodon purpureus]